MLKRHKAAIAYTLILAVFTAYVMLDTFVITKVYDREASGAAGSGSVQESDDSGNTGDMNDSDSDTSDSESDPENSAPDNMHGGSGEGRGKPDGAAGKGHGPGGKKGKSRKTNNDSSDNSGGKDSSDGNSADKQANVTVPSEESDNELAAGKSATAAGQLQQGSPVDSYEDDNISIKVTEYRENDTTVYVADVDVSSAEYLRTALAHGSYGKNVTEKTSEIAEGVNAILAVNGDYYGAQEKGYVIRNGKLYRDTALANQEDLVIYEDGSFGIINESDITAQELISKGAVQTLSFGPALVQNGTIAVSENEEVGKAMASNPRTAIGIIDGNHYVFVVSDGRTDESEGLSLYQLAEFMDSLGVKTAYNLDGGGSSTMYFNGSVVNNTTGGMGSSERSVSDIVYIGK